MIAFRHDRQGEPWIPVRPEAYGNLLFLPLCPSTNARQKPTFRGGRPMLVNTHEANQYIETIGTWLRLWVADSGFRPIRELCRLECWMILRSTRQDPSNLLKILYDSLEAGRIVENDRLLLPNVRGVWHDAKRPEIIVRLPVMVGSWPGSKVTPF